MLTSCRVGLAPPKNNSGANPTLRLFGLLAVLIVCRTAVAEQKATFDKLDKPRVIVLTDITNEPDDEESMVRFLVYANEFDVEGLIATTSVWLRNKIRPENIRERIEAYGKVRGNLLKHAPGFPTKQHLLGVTKSGLPEFGMEGVGQGKSSQGSRHIIEVVDRADERPVWISVWGGRYVFSRHTPRPSLSGQMREAVWTQSSPKTAWSTLPPRRQSGDGGRPSSTTSPLEWTGASPIRSTKPITTRLRPSTTTEAKPSLM